MIHKLCNWDEIMVIPIMLIQDDDDDITLRDIDVSVTVMLDSVFDLMPYT